MSVVNLPDDLLKVTDRGFRLLPRNLFSTAIFSGQVLPHGPVAQVWTGDLTLVAKQEQDGRYADGIMAKLRGMAVKFRAHDPARIEPYYNIEIRNTGGTSVEYFDDDSSFDDGTGFLSGLLPPSAAVAEDRVQGRRNLLIDGLPASKTAVLRHGDLIEIRPSGIPSEYGHLYIVTGVSNTNENGETRVYFEPGLRTGVQDGDMVVLNYPSSVFRLVSDDEAAFQVGIEKIWRGGFRMVEVLPT